MADAAPVLELRGIAKRFPGVLANDAVDFDLEPAQKPELHLVRILTRSRSVRRHAAAGPSRQSWQTRNSALCVCSSWHAEGQHHWPQDWRTRGNTRTPERPSTSAEIAEHTARQTARRAHILWTSLTACSATKLVPSPVHSGGGVRTDIRDRLSVHGNARLGLTSASFTPIPGAVADRETSSAVVTLAAARASP